MSKFIPPLSPSTGQWDEILECLHADSIPPSSCISQCAEKWDEILWHVYENLCSGTSRNRDGSFNPINTRRKIQTILQEGGISPLSSQAARWDDFLHISKP